MFGYIVPLKQELRMRELAQYNAYYCGLCASIGARFGQTARLTLNYDSTFLAMLLTGLSGGSAQPCIPRSCGYKPFQKSGSLLQIPMRCVFQQILMLRLRGISCAMIGKMKRKHLHLQEKAY